MLRVTAPAKVNLHLSVGARRADGYHDLEGVFHALKLGDAVLIEPAESLSVECELDLGVDPHNNLAHRAAEAMGAVFEREPAVRIVLEKHIPHGAGLGGGSSDAAATVAGLCALWGIDLADPRCIQAAASVGADVPFFLVPSGCALMTGRGDRVERSLPALAGAPVALVRPLDPVPTPAAYEAFDADPQPSRPADEVVAALEAGDPVRLAAALFNNLEAASSVVVPAVAEAIAWVRRQPGILGAAVAGSGSAVFALAASNGDARMAAASARTRGWWAAATHLGDSGVRVHDDMKGNQ